jgi:hypothetical protein
MSALGAFPVWLWTPVFSVVLWGSMSPPVAALVRLVGVFELMIMGGWTLSAGLVFDSLLTAVVSLLSDGVCPVLDELVSLM